MEVYLNTISLGNNTAGVQAAANLYYGKDVSELNVAECASIVSITQNPTKYNPFTGQVRCTPFSVMVMGESSTSEEK